MNKPPKLNKGDNVAIVSLSSGVLGEDSSKHQVDIGIERLQAFGLNPVFMPNALKGIDYLNKNPEARAEDLKTAFADETIKGIICAIGGDDSFRLLPYLLEDKVFLNDVKNTPKLFTGFSDTTVNHLMFYKLGMTSYYGPNFLNDLAELDHEMLPYSKEAFKSYLSNPSTTNIPASDIWYEERTDFSKQVINTPRIHHTEQNGYEALRGDGIVSGQLLGGCLESLYDLLIGARYPEEKNIAHKYNIFPDINEWHNKILFIETSEETPSPRHFEKMFEAFNDLGIFEAVKAIIVGKPQNEIYYQEYKEVLVRVTEPTQTPILYNLNFGHAYPRTVLPYGLEAQIDFDNKEFSIMEPLFLTE